jgi:hypothetical protein
VQSVLSANPNSGNIFEDDFASSSNAHRSFTVGSLFAVSSAQQWMNTDDIEKSRKTTFYIGDNPSYELSPNVVMSKNDFA